MDSDSLRDRLNRLTWPAATLDQPEPIPGQLWRAEWDGSACLVLIFGEPSDRTVPVLAATSDHIGDDRAVVAISDNGMEPAVWAGITASVMTFTLEHRIVDLTGESLKKIGEVAAGQQAGDWAPITSNLDDRVLVRAELTERLQILSSAEWLPEPSRGPTLAELASDAGISASQVAEHLGITPGAARRLLLGQQPARSEQAGALVELFGSVPDTAVTFDAGLVASLDQPEFRPALRLAATRSHRGNERAARCELAGQAMALAARPRQRGSLTWTALIRERLRET